MTSRHSSSCETGRHWQKNSTSNPNTRGSVDITVITIHTVIKSTYHVHGCGRGRGRWYWQAARRIPPPVARWAALSPPRSPNASVTPPGWRNTAPAGTQHSLVPQGSLHVPSHTCSSSKATWQSVRHPRDLYNWLAWWFNSNTALYSDRQIN